MTTLPWYATGTVAVTNASNAVVGTATAWLANVDPHQGFIGPDGRTYDIASVNSDTSITLAVNYGGSTLSAQVYSILPAQGYIHQLAVNAANLLSQVTAYTSIVGAADDFIQFKGGTPAPTNRTPVQVWADLTKNVVEVDVASSATTDLGAAASPKIRITGTTNPTSFGTTKNVMVDVRFSGILTITASATIILPQGLTTITTAAGDTMRMSSDASATPVWTIRHFTKANGVTLFPIGAVGAPSVAIGATTDGFYQPAAHQIGVSINGALTATFSATSLLLALPLTITSAVTIASATSAVLDDFLISAATTTVTGTTAITTAKGFNKASIYIPTITDAGAVTITNAATLYIEGAPAAAGSVTITNAYALWIDSGTTRLDGSLLGADITATTASATAFAIGRLGATTPAFLIDASTATSITGLKIKSAATGGGVAVSAIGETNVALAIDGAGSGTITLGGTSTGNVVVSRLLSTIAQTITSASATALAVGLAGTSNPAFLVDASTASSATGLKIKSAAAAAGLALSVITSGTNENLTIDAAGSGTITLGGASTGTVAVSRVLTSLAHTITSASATSLAVGPNGTTTPIFAIDSSTASAVAGLLLTGAVTGGTVALVVTDSGSNASFTLNAKGTGTIGIGSVSTGAVTITPATTITGALTLSSTLTQTSTSASALVVGRQGATNPVLQIDASTASVATGLKIKGAAAAAGLALSVITSGTNENLTIDAAGSGTITFAGTSTGRVTITPVTTITGALTLSAVGLVYNGVTLTGTTGTGNMMLSASPTTTGTLTAAAANFSGAVTPAALLDISGAAAGQIKFPATQNGSANVNTLDDYEEGTFTVTAVAGTSGTITLTSGTGNTGFYTKIGRAVFFNIYVLVASVSSPVGTLNFNGLPFAVASLGGNKAALTISYDGGAGSTNITLWNRIDTSSSSIEIYKMVANVLTNIAGDIQASTEFIISGFYMAAT